jgi:predicted AlkP superfamily phosphohydrolase/phosphomutase
MSNRNAKVLLIGWDAADRKMINPLLGRGLMPTLNKFVEEGVMGNLATLPVPPSPAPRWC